MNRAEFPPLLFFGAGKMGGAMLDGALKAGWPAAAITVIDPHPSADLSALALMMGFALNPASIAKPRLVIAAIKPQKLDEAAADLRQIVDADTIFLSIMAGKSIADIAMRLPALVKIIRAMPNTPAAIGRGITGAYALPSLEAEDLALVQQVLAALGALEWVASEALIDAVTALSGSGPAYVFFLVEALAKAGEKAGFSPELAMRFARATVEGAGALLHAAPQIEAAILRQNVTSPGGTTAAALEHLMAEDGLIPLMERTVLAAQARAKALSG
jgi:pyrroline-5-carboxylate reductase